MPRTIEFAPAPAEDLETWSRPRTDEELFSLLGRRMAALALDNTEMTDEDFEDVGVHDLMTV